MLAKVISSHPPSSDRQQGFRARVVYACAKVADTKGVKLLNLGGVWTDAAQAMDFTAALNPRMHTPVCHIVLSWSETEVRSDQEMIAAAEAVLKDFGAHGHQAVIAPHRDRPSLHVHIILNRVHPITGEALSLSNDYARLERACRRVEHHMGWPTDRGRFDTEIVNGDVELRPKPGEHWVRKTREREMGLRPDSKAATAWQTHTAAGYLRDAITDNLREFVCKVMDYALKWRSVHTGLARAGLEYARVRSGARIREIETGRFMQAGQLGSKYGFRQMCKKLGPFVPPSVTNATSDTNAPLTPRQQVRRQKQEQDRERRMVRATLRDTRHPGAQALRALIREEHQNAVAALKKSIGMPRPRPGPAPIAPASERYRHAVRRGLSDMAPRDDYTARRQNWMLSPIWEHPNIPKIIATLIAPYSDAVRPDGKGNLLFARRHLLGSIHGVERLALRQQTPTEMRAASNGGICVIGPRSADVCVLVRTPYDAITAILQVEGPPPLVIVTDDAPDSDQVAHLLQVVKERRVIIAMGSEDPTQKWAERMQCSFPTAKFWTQEPDTPESSEIRRIVERHDGPPGEDPQAF